MCDFYLVNQELKTKTKSNHHLGRLCRKIDKTGVLPEFWDIEYDSGSRCCQCYGDAHDHHIHINTNMYIS